MKKAKVVEVPEGVVPFKEFEQLKQHALNSLMWYCTNYSKTEGELREKLLAKGYPEGPVQVVDYTGETKEWDFVEEALTVVRTAGMVDDQHYARSFVERKLAQGYGLNRVKRELYSKKLPQEVMEEVLEEFQDEDPREKIEELVEKLLNTSTYRKLEEPKRRTKLTQALVTKGFSFHDINDVLQDLEE